MYSVVVLNKNYEYWSEVDLKKVMKWFLKDKIEILVSKEDEEIRSVELRIKVPLVVRLVNFISYKIKHDRIQYSDQAVFNRDGNQCQYWHRDQQGRKFVYQCEESERTIDHIIPRHRGGKTSFENCVCSCKNCNINIKKNRLPEDVGLELIRKPFVPRFKKGDYAVFRFIYNPKKVSHKYYVESFLKNMS